jgi:hypothetical protein
VALQLWGLGEGFKTPRRKRQLVTVMLNRASELDSLGKKGATENRFGKWKV